MIEEGFILFEFRKDLFKIQFDNGLTVSLNCGIGHYSPNYSGELQNRQFIELPTVEVEIYKGSLFRKHVNPIRFANSLEIHNLGTTSSTIAGYVKPDKVAELIYNISRLSKEEVKTIVNEDNK